MREVSISVIKYDLEFTKRSKDLKRNVWFSFPNDLLLHPDFDDITGEELKWFIWCVSVCSKINNSLIRLNVDHACRKLNLKSKDFDSMCEKLQGKQIVIDTTAARPQDDRSTTATNITNNTLHNKQYITNITSSEQSALPIVSDKVEIVLSSSKKVMIKKELINSWADTYDQEFLKLSLNEMKNWLLANEHKAPKSDWARFMNSWFKRGWEQYRKTMKSNPKQTTTEDLMAFMGWGKNDE